ncbi:MULTISPECIES: hypothetical protein [unclassified Azospirillum]|uniref:hypothetical protein n=1 Tax=unclassified Azospirillum TaxID=2630922 RepID=UPI000B624721|nr:MULTISPECIES: hypothetical protein [unclassified Azospirillum]SNS50712.1 hypothetical protein SAMN05880556_10648 [Azospirillum sp. RU38E]SNS70962.1 hypothetical protein SAMN05880591_10689 [Azospirillum sp. RU37A]
MEITHDAAFVVVTTAEELKEARKLYLGSGYQENNAQIFDDLTVDNTAIGGSKKTTKNATVVLFTKVA